MTGYWHLFVAEARRTLRSNRRYWMNELAGVVSLYLFFVLIVFVGGALSGEAVSNSAKASVLIGLMMWNLSLGCLGLMGWAFYNESATGTLEQLYLSPFGILPVLLVRSLVMFLWSLFLTFAAAALAIWTTSVQIQFRPTEIAVILPLTVTGVYGFGLALAALTLLFKRTHQLMNIFQLFFLFFTGSLIPLEQLHWAIRLFGELLPLTAGIQALRAVGLHGAGFAILAPHLGKIAVTSAVWLIGGMAVYSLADRWARRQGSIGQF